MCKDLYLETIKKFGNKFDYIKCSFDKKSENITIRCKIHDNMIETTLKKHLKSLNGCCKECENEYRREKFKSNIFDVLKLCREKHNNRYDYSLVNHIDNMHSKVKIICKEHGIFEQRINVHLKGHSCPKCSKYKLHLKLKKSNYDFIKQSNNVHGNRYDYSLCEYKNDRTKVKIICKEHGIFEQIAGNHIRGSICPKCSLSGNSSKNENKIKKFLNDLGLSCYKERPLWLQGKELDIFIPEFNIAIEYNGIIFHHSGTNIKSLDRYLKDVEYHYKKYKVCKDNGIDLIHIFEFEDLEIWMSKLKDYFSNTNSYEIVFENSERVISKGKQYYKFYGKSDIISKHIDMC